MERRGKLRQARHGNDLAKIRTAIDDGLKTIPNLFFAFIYNVLGVPIAAGVLYPFLGFCSAQLSRAQR